MEHKTLAEATDMVKKQENSIDMYINPNDLIHQDIDSWDNVDIDKLKDELAASMSDSWTYGINHPYESLIQELAVNLYVEDMQRIKENHLNPEEFNSIEHMVMRGYWVNSMNRQEVTELVYENMENVAYFHEYENEALQEIENAILEARIEGLE
jgi:hypothetical protein